MLKIDGRLGEGGGQVLRTSVALSAALGVPVKVEQIRGGRKKPGLLRQHLTAVRATAEITGGTVEGAELGSTELTFEPGTIRAGEYRFSINSAGSALLVLQTILPPLMLADGESFVVIEGGTHNSWAPPFEAIQRAFAPLLERAGVTLELNLERYGFYPAGGGRFTARIVPAKDAQPLRLLERGPVVSRYAEVLLAHLPEVIAQNELGTLAKRLPWVTANSEIVECNESQGPGNALHVTIESGEVTEVFTGFGQKNVRAKDVGKQVAEQVVAYLASDAPVGEHLADQLMVPLALLAGGEYRVTQLSKHARTNAEVISAFLPEAIRFEEEGDTARVLVRARE